MSLLEEEKFNTALQLRARAELFKKEYKALIAESNKYLIPYLTITDTKTVDHEKYGKFTLVPESATATIHMPTLKAILLLKGVGVKIIEEAQKKATNKGSKAAYVKYTPLKKPIPSVSGTKKKGRT